MTNCPGCGKYQQSIMLKPVSYWVEKYFNDYGTGHEDYVMNIIQSAFVSISKTEDIGFDIGCGISAGYILGIDISVCDKCKNAFTREEWESVMAIFKGRVGVKQNG